MKLDLIAIEKLSPVGLYPLADLRALVSVLVAVIRAGIGSARDVRSYAHMLVQYRNILREQARHNQNLKIKAWVKQCPTRMAWVRSVIGEAAIRSWTARRRAAYTATKFMGDGQQKKPDVKRRGKYEPRTRKLFALAQLSEVEKLLPFRPRWPRRVRKIVSGETGNVRHGARLTSFGHSGKPQQSHQSRPLRPQKPVRFFPSEIGVKIRELHAEPPKVAQKRNAQEYGEDPPAKMAGPSKPGLNGSGKYPRQNPQPEKPP